MAPAIRPPPGRSYLRWPVTQAVAAWPGLSGCSTARERAARRTRYGTPGGRPCRTVSLPVALPAGADRARSGQAASGAGIRAGRGASCGPLEDRPALTLGRQGVGTLPVPRLPACIPGVLQDRGDRAERPGPDRRSGSSGGISQPLPGRILLHVGMRDMATRAAWTGLGITSAPRRAASRSKAGRLLVPRVSAGHPWHSPSPVWPGSPASRRRWWLNAWDGRPSAPRIPQYTPSNVVAITVCVLPCPSVNKTVPP
jgi:hypothetical protein